MPLWPGVRAWLRQDHGGLRILFPHNIFRVDSLAEALRLLLWRRGQLHRSLARGTLVLCRVLRLIWKVGQYVGDGIERRGIGEVVAY